jgi:hypothetical protein
MLRNTLVYLKNEIEKSKLDDVCQSVSTAKMGTQPVPSLGDKDLGR